jgi:hypothetical protein
MKIVALALGLMLLGSLAHAQDDLRYVVPGALALLWKSHPEYRVCLYQARVLKKPVDDAVDFCAESIVGKLEAPTRVERLDDGCGPMVAVRVLDGPFQGSTGCFSAEALTSIKPESVK